jgi:hypothetical protein
MGNTVVHIRHRMPGKSDTHCFTRQFGSVEAANRFVLRAGYTADPHPTIPSLYAVVVEY